ncbi:hypothetical protein T440DRAFT_470641 [Plenodomus tracheiphilus IPT5]|uniref:Uncharacterized protein n=1 Tax=Plenodomus tracheiphilus IPT5 TaxID=1408161 RepID=A0A6A7AXH9_9PLEO|nr:hypothetical protein T440DRAFT_470641 [Plenodomus tracheiphilus IPT5]
MPALPRLRWPLYFPYFRQLRTLRTSPKLIPDYIKRWDPTKAVRTTDKLKEVLVNPKSLPRGDAVQRSGVRRVTLGRSSFPKLRNLIDFASKEPFLGVLHTPLWLAYQDTKRTDPELLSRMPTHSWDALWKTIKEGIRATKGEKSMQRKDSLYQLENDMRGFGARLSSVVRSQQLMDIFIVRRGEELAISEWESDHRSYSDSMDVIYPPEHLEVGARLFALNGNVHRSLQLMDQLLSTYPNWDLSVMMDVFRAHTNSNAKHDHDIARDLYFRMKKQRGEAVTLDDYTSWFVGFLEARHLSYAKLVFRDMVTEGHLTTVGGTEAVDDVLKKLHMLYRLGTDISSMTSIALDVLRILPPVYHDHVFGDWMKAAVIYRAPEAAGQILDMMYQRRIQPTEFHFNMLLKALLRTKERHNILKAENIGWQMIEEARKAHKRLLRVGGSTAEVINRQANKAPHGTKEPVRTAPVADVTTFALIMHHHAKDLQWEHVDYLSRQLNKADVFPNATIMNVLIDNKCRQGRYADAWGIYTMLTQPPDGEQGVYPNGATFRHLWKTLRLALGDHATRDDPDLPTPRELLKETVEWWRMTRSRYDASRFLHGLAASNKGAIMALMLHCFSYTQDLVGSLIALHVLRHYFDIFPDDRATGILLRQIAWVDMSRESASSSSQYFHSRSNALNSARITKIYNVLYQQRVARMELGREGLDGLTDEEVLDLGLNGLSELVRVVLKRNYGPELVEDMIEAATRVVGLPDLPTGDMTAWEVA